MASFWNADDSEIEFSEDDDLEDWDSAGGKGYKKLEKEDKREDWDLFQNNPPENETLAIENQKAYVYTIKTLKILTYIVVSFVVLASAVVSKMSVLLMTSQIQVTPNVTRPLCHPIPKKTLEVTISWDEKIQWTWALFFCFLVPEIGTFLRSLRICLFKGRRRPTWLEFLIPCFFEVCHTVGLGLFTFCVLPSVHVVKGAMMQNAVCLIPGVFSMLSRYPSKTKRSWVLALATDGIAILAQVYGLVLWPFLASQDNVDKPWLFPLSTILISFGWWENFVSEKGSHIPFIRALGRLRSPEPSSGPGVGRIRNGIEATRYRIYLYIPFIKTATFLGTMCLSIFLMGGEPWMYFDGFSNLFSYTNLTYVQVGETISAGLKINNTMPDVAPLAISQTVTLMHSEETALIWTLFIQFAAAYVCYITSKFACKICIQGFGFSFPITLANPVTLAILVSFCGTRNQEICFGSEGKHSFSFLQLPPYLFWNCPTGDFTDDFIVGDYGWIWILLLLSQTWIAVHIWYPNTPRLAPTEKLFVRPMYNAILGDQDLVLNRRRDKEILEAEAIIAEEEKERNRNQVIVDEGESGGGAMGLGLGAEEGGPTFSKFEQDKIPRIIACATMWHETKDEMIAMFKSIFRMDEDQCSRRIALKYFEMKDPDYYEFETNIFFDDAFVKKFPLAKDSPYEINDYVKLMISAIDEAASLVHEINMKIRPPKKIATPYGGRLEWVLPGKTRMIAHLKNKDKIRHRKRWSQVMYMYYLLGFRITHNPEIPPERQDVVAANTFLLALDGDIDFQPHAVELVVDLMKKNSRLGAACGRIHPIGPGPMVWYQKFEYAIGHWLIKATEHMIGCVLCSPGCFSLFRAQALMDDNVMAKYTTLSEEPRHYVQYDQGEDRWLCTLLLQQGWRVEYCAASDSFTHAPEGFDEFYNQRRRWVPSTMANILDLLVDYKRIIKINPDISLPYIIYQSILMGGSILGPGTIFLMLVGAFNTAFKVDNLTCLYLNMIPLLTFTAVCYFCKSKTQLVFAQILSVIYALVMVAVLVALALQIVDDGLLAPSSLFLVAITISFIVAAFVHPMEFSCLLFGVVYYITIPSMYLLLIIYSLFNLNDVTWGTRENPALAAEQKAQEAATTTNKKGNFITNLLPKSMSQNLQDEEGSFELSFAGLFKIMCCVSPKPKEELNAIGQLKESVDKMIKKMSELEKSMTSTAEVVRHQSLTSGTASVASSPGLGPRSGSGSGSALLTRGGQGVAIPSPIPENPSSEMMEGHETSSLVPRIATATSISTATAAAATPSNSNLDGVSEKLKKEIEKQELAAAEIQKGRNDLMNPYWSEAKELNKAQTDFITSRETTFWKLMVGKYLLPIFEDAKKKKEISEGLRDLRNRTVGAFFMINAVFVTAMFLLQLNKDKIYFDWPLGGTHKMNYTSPSKQASDTITISSEYLHLEPLGLLFVGFYAIILVVQFFAMLLHRFGTFSQIMAITSIGLCSRNRDTVSDEAKGLGSHKKVISNLQKIKHANEDSEQGTIRDNTGGRRQTIVNLHKAKNKKVRIHTLDRAFEKGLKQVKDSPEKRRRMSRIVPNADVDALVNRRSTILQRRSSIVERRKSQINMETLGRTRPGNSSSFGSQDNPGGKFFSVQRKTRFHDSDYASEDV